MLKRALPAAILFSLLTGMNSYASDFDATKAKLQTAMQSDLRSAQETERDRNRRPVETLEFFGLRDDMRILELVPGGGWYTKLLAPTVAEKGEYFAALGTRRVKENLMGKPGLEKIEIKAEDARLFREEGARFLSVELPENGFDLQNVDMVLTFRNYHNFAEDARKAINEAAFKALKPGGVYAVVDHTARHMESSNSENRRRVDPVLAIKEIQEAGFEFEDYTDLHFRKDDELIYEVGRRSVRGNTDRWTFKFRKPK